MNNVKVYVYGMLLIMSSNTLAVSHVTSILVGLASILAQTCPLTPNSTQLQEVMFFPKKSTLTQCLNNNVHLRNRWYHDDTIKQQGIIKQTAQFLALQKVTGTQLWREANNLVLTQELRDAFLPTAQHNLSDVLNKSLIAMPQRACRVYAAATACNITQRDYRKQKKQQKKKRHLS